MSAPLTMSAQVSDYEHGRGCFLQELDCKGKISAPCLFMLLGPKATASKRGRLSCSESPRVHTCRSTWEGDLTLWSRLLRFVGAQWMFLALCPSSAKQGNVSAQCFSSLGKQKHLNMTCKQSSSPWFKQDLRNNVLM